MLTHDEITAIMRDEADQYSSRLGENVIKARFEGFDAPFDGETCDRLMAEVYAMLARKGWHGTPAPFSRAFKASAGLPPFVWLRERRIELSKGLLADLRLSLAEVSLCVGFFSAAAIHDGLSTRHGLHPRSMAASATHVGAFCSNPAKGRSDTRNTARLQLAQSNLKDWRNMPDLDEGDSRWPTVFKSFSNLTIASSR